MGIPVFLSSGGRTKKVDWEGQSFDDLAKLYFEAFCLEKDGDQVIRRGHFYLKHSEFQVFFEGFELSELAPGSVVEVRGPHAIRCDDMSWEVDPDVTGSALSLQSDEDCETEPDNNDNLNSEGDIQEQDLMSMQGRNFNEEDRQGEATLRRRIWRTLDDPSYSKTARFLTIFVMVVILISTICFMLETLPTFYERNPSPLSVWYTMEAACIVVFTVELLLRIVCAPPSVLSFRRPFNFTFFRDFMNIIDVVAVLPFYVELAMENASVPGLSVLRVVRLIRIFRLFKVSKGALTIFIVTMKKSAKPLYMLVFFTMLALVIFSSLMYYAERGVYDTEVAVWKRLFQYECAVVVRVLDPAAEEVMGTEASQQYAQDARAWLEQLADNELAGSGCMVTVTTSTMRNFTCLYDFRDLYETEADTRFAASTITYSTSKLHCAPLYEISPYESIPATMWWCLVTVTTVGYGDVSPISWYGRLLGMLVMLCGILVIALPITVIGSNFADVYRHVALLKTGRRASTE